MTPYVGSALFTAVVLAAALVCHAWGRYRIVIGVVIATVAAAARLQDRRHRLARTGAAVLVGVRFSVRVVHRVALAGPPRYCGADRHLAVRAGDVEHVGRQRQAGEAARASSRISACPSAIVVRKCAVPGARSPWCR